MTMKNLQVRVDEKLYDDAMNLFSELEIPAGAVINAMLRRAVTIQGVPFEISKTTAKDMDIDTAVEMSMKKMNDQYKETFKNLVDR